MANQGDVFNQEDVSAVLNRKSNIFNEAVWKDKRFIFYLRQGPLNSKGEKLKNTRFGSGSLPVVPRRKLTWKRVTLARRVTGQEEKQVEEEVEPTQVKKLM